MMMMVRGRGGIEMMDMWPPPTVVNALGSSGDDKN